MSEVDAWLTAVRSVRMEQVFNPYNSVCTLFDTREAPQVRFSVLSQMLSCAQRGGVDSIWIGRDLGYRGGRRTGLALTDDVHFDMHLSRWGIECPAPFLKGRAISERTASVVWNELHAVKGRVFLWNVFPFHPHDLGDEFSNRAHTAKERQIGEELLSWLVKIVRPASLVAVGQNASGSAARCGHGSKVYTVRHPSYGGQREFIEGIRAVYGSA